MSLKNLGDVSYFRLNNEINRPVNGQIPLHKDKEALRAFFLENVKPNSMAFNSITDKINYLIENDYIESEFIGKYEPAFIEKLSAEIHSQKFRFQSFMAAYKFYQQYALKTNDGESYLESIEDRVLFNALYFADGDENLASDLANEMIHQRYQPATPSFLNAGRSRRGELVSCFLIQVTDDMNSIGRSINSALQLSRIGGGVGISLSNLREAGAPIKGYAGAASGVVPVMKLFEDSFSYSNQLGQRQGAGVVYLDVFHPDILAFLSTKKENADEKVRVKTLSLGVTVPDKFYELARNNEDMYLFSPYSVEKEYGKPYNYIDITAMYDELVANPNITKTKINARELETEISKLQQESGYPYIVNVDTANRHNPIDGKIIMSNLCSEILQVQTPSELNDAQEFVKLGTDISCNLGSTNILNMMTSPDFGRSIRAMTRALTFVTDSSSIDAVPSIKNGNQQAHTFGLGAMGLHSYLAKHHIEYGSPESVEFTNIYFMLMNYWTLVESNNIAVNVKKPLSVLKNQNMLMVLTLTNTLQANTFLNLTVSKNFSMATSSHKPKIGKSSVNSLRKMDSTIKTVWLLRQMAQSLTLTTVRLLSIQSHNVLKNVKKRKSEKSIIQPTVFQQTQFLSTLQPTTWTCVKLSTFMPLRLNTLIKVCH